MNPVAKYFLSRLALFAAVAVPLMFLINVLLAFAVGLLVSMIASMWLLKGMRTEMVDHIDDRMKARREEKEQLRAELRGDDS